LRTCIVELFTGMSRAKLLVISLPGKKLKSEMENSKTIKTKLCLKKVNLHHQCIKHTMLQETACWTINQTMFLCLHNLKKKIILKL
jgi:hypothetical protein